MSTTQPVTDWKEEWFETEDAAYLNTATHAANSFPFGPIQARALQRRPRVARARLRASDNAIPALMRMWFR
jgi:hypothetical protein